MNFFISGLVPRNKGPIMTTSSLRPSVCLSVFLSVSLQRNRQKDRLWMRQRPTSNSSYWREFRVSNLCVTYLSVSPPLSIPFSPSPSPFYLNKLFIFWNPTDTSIDNLISEWFLGRIIEILWKLNYWSLVSIFSNRLVRFLSQPELSPIAKRFRTLHKSLHINSLCNSWGRLIEITHRQNRFILQVKFKLWTCEQKPHHKSNPYTWLSHASSLKDLHSIAAIDNFARGHINRHQSWNTQSWRLSIRFRCCSPVLLFSPFSLSRKLA